MAVAGTFGLALSGAVWANDMGAASTGSDYQATSQGRFANYDANGDGYISHGGGQAAAENSTENASARGQNTGRQAQASRVPELVVVTITPIETASQNDLRRERLFRQLDSNDDGWLSKGEAGMNDALDGHFSTLDSDGNGRLDRAEMAQVDVQESAHSQASDRSSDTDHREAKNRPNG
jgi:Ca2+-binding EF-hand superfamily protein